jgi:hypothetical protein
MMFSISRCVCLLTKLYAAIAFLFFAANGFAAPPPGVLDETHAAVQAVMLFKVKSPQP